LSKKPPSLSSEDAGLSFSLLQSKWYGIIKDHGFQDQEDTTRTDRPLKKWSGLSALYVDVHQPAGVGMVSSFPQSIYREEEIFGGHPGFHDLCQRICRHGNSVSTPMQVAALWEDYCLGLSCREMGVKYGLNYTTAFRTVKRVKEWMNLMGTEPEDSAPAPDMVVVLRAFDPEMDNPMVYGTWRNCLWYAEKRDERLANQFYSDCTQKIRELLSREGIEVRVACSQDDPQFIVGYSVTQETHLEFVYVKIDYRKRGIGALLSKGYETHSEPFTKIAKKIVERKNHGNP
jgi:hypothetical protein